MALAIHLHNRGQYHRFTYHSQSINTQQKTIWHMRFHHQQRFRLFPYSSSPLLQPLWYLTHHQLSLSVPELTSIQRTLMCLTFPLPFHESKHPSPESRHRSESQIAISCRRKEMKQKFRAQIVFAFYPLLILFHILFLFNYFLIGKSPCRLSSQRSSMSQSIDDSLGGKRKPFVRLLLHLHAISRILHQQFI